MTQQNVFTDWTAETAKKFGRETIVAHHTLHQREMFSDAGLARLLDEYPRDRLGVFTMSTEQGKVRDWRNGSAGDLPGAELLKAVENGRLWLNLRAANEHLQAYADLSDEIFGAMEAVTPGLKTRKRDVGVLISSPSARVHYHLDIPMVALWQIRGVKRFYVYPREIPFASDHEIEDVVLRTKDEEISYLPEFDQHALVVDLEPGMMSTWPQNAPHRIDNHGMLNVSLSCEFQTLTSLVRANALYANGVLRRRFGKSPAIARDGAAMLWAKAGLARGMKLFMGRKVWERHTAASFVVDPDAEGAVRDIAPA